MTVLNHLVPGPYDFPDQQDIRRSTHTARKTHECDVCPELIQPGQRYNVHIYTEDGEFKTLKSHARP